MSQRSMDFYFTKKTPSLTQLTPKTTNKRKVPKISSDEEESPRKSTTANKRPKIEESPGSYKKKKIMAESVASLFSGELKRENKQKVVHSPENVGTNAEFKEEQVPHIKKEVREDSNFENSHEATKKDVKKISATANGLANKLPTPKTKIKKETSCSDLETSILSDEQRFERKRMAAALYQKHLNRAPVINPGSKEVPKGEPNCLSGLSFCITGVLESFTREEASEIIKEFGGKVSATVGKKLNYLVAGEDAGPKKLSDAETLQIPILSLEDLFQLIVDKSSNTTLSQTRSSPQKINVEGKSPVKVKKEVTCSSSNIKKASNVCTPVTVKQEDIKQKNIEYNGNEKIDSISGNSIGKVSSNLVNVENLAWVDKYKPTSVKQIIGQQGPSSNCSKLTNWLKNWHCNHSGGKKSQKPNPWAKNDDGSYYKAVLLSGPPGVGKTTTAMLVCNELGFDIVEFNASDTRSKRLLKEEVSELLSNKSLYGYFHGNAQTVSKKHVLVMDEVDGMAGNEDRGGIQELIALIKDSHIPIICMCNDRNHQKMRSLVNYCYDLRFIKPRLEQIKGFVKSICFKEKLKLSSEQIDDIILATNNDIRQSINHICLLRASKDVELTSSTQKTAQKDLKMGPWEVVRKVFSAEEHKHMSINDKLDLFFHDYSMSPLFVQQNYLSVSPIGPKSEVLKKVALTSDALSLGDLVDRRIRTNSAWSLLPVQAVFSSYFPGEYMNGHFTGQINFPGWLGKYSRTNKRSRLAQEIHDHTRLRTSGSRLSIRLDYAPFLLSHIVRPLKDKGLQGVEESLQAIQEYRLLREDIESLIELTTWPGKKSLMDAVEGRVKASLTRSYNKEILPYSYSVVTAAKKKKVEAMDGDIPLDIMENEMEIAESDEETDNLENDNLIKAKKGITVSNKSSNSKTKKTASSSQKTSAKNRK